MDQNSLPPLPSPEDLFAPSTSQSSSLPFLKNVSLFVPVPPLPPRHLANDHPVLSEFEEPHSPVPPQPTSPLVDRFDCQLESDKTDSKCHVELKKKRGIMLSQEILSEPPCKRARHSETAPAVPSLQYDSREEGEISDDDDDVDQSVIPRSAASCHKLPSPCLAAAHNEETKQFLSHVQMPTNSPQNVTKTLSDHPQLSHPSDVTRHRHHRTHRPHFRLKQDTSKSSHHYPNIAGTNVVKTDQSSLSRKQPGSHSKQEEMDYSKNVFKSSGHPYLSTDRSTGTENAADVLQPSFQNSACKGSNCAEDSFKNIVNRRLSDTDTTAVKETAKKETHFARHHGHSMNSDLLHSKSKACSNDGLQTSADSISPPAAPETVKKGNLEIGLQCNQAPLDSSIPHHRISSGNSRLLCLQHTAGGGTLGSEIAKNVSRSTVHQRTPVDIPVSKNASSSHQQLTNIANIASSGQPTPHSNPYQRSVNSDRALHSAAVKQDSQFLISRHHSAELSDFPKKFRNIESSYHQRDVQHALAAVESVGKLSQPQVSERFARVCTTTSNPLMGSNQYSVSCSDRFQSPVVIVPSTAQPATLAVTQQSSAFSHVFSLPKDLSAPYSPGSLDLDDLFDPDVVSELREAVPNDSETGSNIERTAGLPPSIAVSRADTHSVNTRTNVEDPIVEIDTACSIDELPASEEADVPTESATVDGHGQEYEIIDDLDSNADEMDDVAAVSSDNSEVEDDIGKEDSTPDKHAKSKRDQVKKDTKNKVSEQTEIDVELFDEDGEDGFQAPTVNNKIILSGEL